MQQAKNRGLSRDVVGKYARTESPPTKPLSAKEPAKAEALAEVQLAAD